MTSSSSYEPTSERVTVDDYQEREGDYLIYLFHLATYDFAAPLVADSRVLDYGCGTGYGTLSLAGRCQSIVGVDVSPDAIAFASARYSAENLEFRHIAPVEQSPLPFDDSSFDVILSFQVIEHVPDPHRYLDEVARLLKEHGRLVLATPDRTTRLLPRQRPWNRFHRVEYAPEQLEDLLRAHFAEVQINSMSGDRAVIDRELRRSSRLKWVTLPFTFPGAPEPWRQWGLGGLKRIQARARSRRHAGEHSTSDGIGAAGGAGEAVRPPHGYHYDQSVLRVGPMMAPSVNLVAVAGPPRKRGSGPA